MTKLQRYFRKYNEKYFGGALPEPILRFAEFKHFGHYYQQDGGHIIEFAEWTRRNNTLWRFTLLHEMVHLKHHNKKCHLHGRLFNNEMKRLANAGAFNGLW